MNKREALLVEYQVCEEDNAANFQGYWTLAAIFIGISSALFGGFVYAIIANESLFNILFCQNDPRKTLVVGITVIIVGIANIVILKKLRGWHKRILQNQEINSGRMREIELELSMNRSWRTYALDRWYCILKKNRKTICDQQKWNDLKVVLKKKLPKNRDPKYYEKLENLKEASLQLIKQYFETDGCKYVPSSSTNHYPCILFTIILLWVLIIAVAVFLIIDAYCSWQSGLVASGIIFVGSLICVLCKKWKYK